PLDPRAWELVPTSAAPLHPSVVSLPSRLSVQHANLKSRIKSTSVFLYSIPLSSSISIPQRSGGICFSFPATIASTENSHPKTACSSSADKRPPLYCAPQAPTETPCPPSA